MEAVQSRMVQSNSETLHILTNSDPIDAPHFILDVKRYHIPAGRAYNINKNESPDTSEDEALQMEVKVIID